MVGLAGKTAMEEAKADMVVDIVEEFMQLLHEILEIHLSSPKETDKKVNRACMKLWNNQVGQIGCNNFGSA